jgi:hypothetical protein
MVEVLPTIRLALEALSITILVPVREYNYINTSTLSQYHARIDTNFKYFYLFGVIVLPRNAELTTSNT